MHRVPFMQLLQPEGSLTDAIERLGPVWAALFYALIAVTTTALLAVGVWGLVTAYPGRHSGGER